MNNKLRELRIEKNLTLKKVASELAITEGCYSNYESGRREPSLDMLKKICTLFEVSSDYLIGLGKF